jgi:hypothetical protein
MLPLESLGWRRLVCQDAAPIELLQGLVGGGGFGWGFEGFGE